MPRFRIVEDSVAGARCFIIYKDANPFITLWVDELNYDTLRHTLGDNVELKDLAEIGAIHDTVTALGGSRDVVRKSIETWLKEKGWLDSKNP